MIGELAAIGRRCKHYEKASCPLRRLNLSPSCHCIFWEASVEYLKQMEEEASLRKKD